MFLSQMVSSMAIVEGFRQMNCSMSGYVWGYFGLISGSLVFLGVVQIVFDKRINGLEISDAHLMKKLSSDLGSEVFLLDTQKIKAFTHKRRIYLSVGLVELLDYEEIKAVAAHELYHVKHTPNRLVANSLAVSSLWLKSYRDDAKADLFAAEMAGRDNLISAFEKLNIFRAEKRIRRLAS
jgi:heat shock protein HtpX